MILPSISLIISAVIRDTCLIPQFIVCFDGWNQFYTTSVFIFPVVFYFLLFFDCRSHFFINHIDFLLPTSAYFFHLLCVIFMTLIFRQFTVSFFKDFLASHTFSADIFCAITVFSKEIFQQFLLGDFRKRQRIASVLKQLIGDIMKSRKACEQLDSRWALLPLTKPLSIKF